MESLRDQGYAVGYGEVEMLLQEIEDAAEAKHRTIYFCVTPDPKGKGRMFMESTGRQCWWIKLGDGKFRAAYKTENPEIRGVENDMLETHYLTVESHVPGDPPKSVRNAKAFEWAFFKGNLNNSQGVESEWYRVWSDDPELLLSRLIKLLHLFPTLAEDSLCAELGEFMKYCLIEPKAQNTMVTEAKLPIKVIMDEFTTIPTALKVKEKVQDMEEESQPRDSPLSVSLLQNNLFGTTTINFQGNMSPTVFYDPGTNSNSLYFAVSPNPFKEDYLQYPTSPGGHLWWWIKIGDGEFRNSYSTHNPDIYGAQNNILQSARLFVQCNFRGENIGCVRNGKAYEWDLLKGGTDGRSRCEWYAVWPRDINLFLEKVKEILLNFRYYKEEKMYFELSRLLDRDHCVVLSKQDMHNL